MSDSQRTKALLVLDPSEVRFLLRRDGLARLRQALLLRSAAHDGWTLILLRVPFLTPEAFTIAERILRAKDHQARLALHSLAVSWLEAEVEPVFQAARLPLSIERRGAPPTLSVGLWEQFLVELVQEFSHGLARALDGERFIQGPARIHLPMQVLAWRPPLHLPTGPRKADICLVSASLLMHAYHDPGNIPLREVPFTLLPPDDLTVIRLAVAANPRAAFLRLGRADELPPHLDALLPDGMATEGLDLFSPAPLSDPRSLS